MKAKGINRRSRKRSKKDSPGAFVDDAWALSKRAINGLNAVRKLLNVEYKYFDNTTSGQSASQAGVVNALTTIPQGATVSTRDGNSVKTMDLRVSYNVFINASATRSSFRLVVFRDHENVGSTPSGSDLLELTGISAAPLSAFSAVNTQMGPDEVGRFTILYDEVVSLSVTGEQIIHRDFRMPLGQHIRWSSTTGSSTREGALFMAIYTNESTNVPTIDWHTRVRYVDN